MKRFTATMFIAIVLLFLFSACSSTVQTNETLSTRDTSLENEFESLLTTQHNYNVKSVHINEESSNSYSVVFEIYANAQNLQEIATNSKNTAEKMLHEKSLELSWINPIVILNDEKYFGWSSKNGTLYSSESYPIAENVDISSINSYIGNSDMSSTEYHTALNWEIVSTQPYTRGNHSCMAWRVYVSDSKYSITNGDIRDLYMELLQTEDPSNIYYSHTVWIFLNRANADGSGMADISIEPVVDGSTAAQVIVDGKKFIITENGVISPSVDVN